MFVSDLNIISLCLVTAIMDNENSPSESLLFSTFDGGDNTYEQTMHSLSEADRDKKLQEIRRFLIENEYSTDTKYVNKLRSFALSRGGLICDEIRKQVWPLLLGINPRDLGPYTEEVELSHHECSQVVLDVNRSIKRFPPAIPTDQRVSMQDQLIRLIVKVITKYPFLQYYQGYHDVAITFLLVVGEEMAFHIMEKLSVNYLKYFMEPTMEKTAELLDYIFPLLEHTHPELCDYIERADLGPMFALPWFLTWYSHTLNDFDYVVRLYDYFLASAPLIPLYLIPVIMIHRQDAIFETECEMSCLHQTLSELPEDLPFDDLLIKATQLYNQYPPEDIRKETEIRRIKKKAIQDEKLKVQSQLRKEFNSRNRARKEKRQRWSFINRVVPTWFFLPGHVGFFVFSASFLAGLYAYYRYANVYDVYNQQNISAK